MPTTTTKGIPVPVTADNNNTPADMLALANWLDDILSGKTTAQINAIAGAARWTGRVVFDTDKGQLMVWDGAFWVIAGGAVGAVIWLAATSLPDGHLLADGQAVSRTTYAKLFAKISTAFGVGDGSTTFNLPNLKGRTVMGFNSADVAFDTVGEVGGAKTVTLTTTELPAHAHTTPNHQHTGQTATDGAHQNATPYLNHGNLSHGHSGNLHVAGDPFPSPTDPVQNINTVVGGAHLHNFTTDLGGFATGSTVGTGAAFSILPPYIVLQPYIKF